MRKPGRPIGTGKWKYPVRINGKRSKLYNAWTAMIQRCCNPNSHNWKWYGAKGVTVCERWREQGGYGNFCEDVGDPEPHLTLGRIDNSKPYEPGNVSWQTWKEQANNRVQGGNFNRDPDSLKGKARAASLPYYVVYQRVKLLGWTEAMALTTPVLPQGGDRRKL